MRKPLILIILVFIPVVALPQVNPKNALYLTGNPLKSGIGVLAERAVNNRINTVTSLECGKYKRSGESMKVIKPGVGISFEGYAPCREYSGYNLMAVLCYNHFYEVTDQFGAVFDIQRLSKYSIEIGFNTIIHERFRFGSVIDVHNLEVKVMFGIEL